MMGGPREGGVKEARAKQGKAREAEAREVEGGSSSRLHSLSSPPRTGGLPSRETCEAPPRCGAEGGGG